jgi:hypothetical protein
MTQIAVSLLDLILPIEVLPSNLLKSLTFDSERRNKIRACQGLSSNDQVSMAPIFDTQQVMVNMTVESHRAGSKRRL